MPASSSLDARHSEGAIRATVIRLSRLDGDGGAVIERAAIVAEGTPAAAIEAWILAHGGEPEAPLIAAASPGLYGLRPDGRSSSGDARTPRRYVLPTEALAER
jgi:hypothetical protein